MSRRSLGSRLGRVLALALAVGGIGLSTAAAAKIPGNAFFQGASGHRMVLVAKDAGHAYLLRAEDGRPKVVERFDNILMGENGGDKRVEGDKRTPEGVYYVQRYIPARDLAAMYGDGAFPINYPNIVDRIEDKTGYGIWLHGVDEDDDDKRATEGCVAFNNRSLNQMKRIIDVGTPVIITRDADFLDAGAYRQRRERFLERLQGFLEAWETSDFAAFRDFIHSDFRSQDGQDAQAFAQQKKRLMAAYPQREVDADRIRIYKENGHRVVYDFDQFYCAPNIAAYGRKRLYFAPEDGQNRLIAEEFFNKPVLPQIRERIRGFVRDWRRAWEAKDLDGYMGHYAADFRHDGAGKAAYRDYKAGIFDRRTDVDVTVKSLRIYQQAPNRYKVSFDQRFDSAEYEDYGVKTLELAGCPGNLRITGEWWRPLP